MLCAKKYPPCLSGVVLGKLPGAKGRCRQYVLGCRLIVVTGRRQGGGQGIMPLASPCRPVRLQGPTKKPRGIARRGAEIGAPGLGGR